MSKCVLPLLLCFSLTAQTVAPLTDQRIIELVRLGVSQNEILRMVATAPQFDFDLRPVSTDAMLKGGVSEEIIKAMAARQNGDPESVSTSNDPTAAAMRNPLIISGAAATSSFTMAVPYPALKSAGM